MSADEVAAVLDGPSVRFERMGAVFEAYEAAALQCEYDTAGRVVFLEIAEFGSATLAAEELIGLSLPAARVLLGDLGMSNLAEDDESLLGDGLVLGVTDGRVTSAGVFNEGYGVELRRLTLTGLLGDDTFVTVCQARYSGVYEGAAWLAFQGMPQHLPADWNAGDESAAEFFQLRADLVGRGDAPSVAYADLRRRLGLVHARFDAGEAAVPEHYPMTVVGSSAGMAIADRWEAVALHPQMLRVVTTDQPWSLETMAEPPFPRGTGRTADGAVAAMLRNRGSGS